MLRLFVVLITLSAVRAVALSQPTGTQAAERFQVVSIRPCDTHTAPPTGIGGRGSATGIVNNSPGRFSVQCATLEALIEMAYVRNGEPLLNNFGPSQLDARRISGGPSWVRSEKYTIEAKAEGTPESKVMMGPMLRAVLEERFRLTLHRETDQKPMYALMVAKGGLKMQPIGNDGCETRDPDRLPRDRASGDAFIAAMHSGAKPVCGLFSMMGTASRREWYFGGTTLRNFASTLSGAMDRAVIDKTAAVGEFNIHLVFTPDEHTPGRAATPANPGEPSEPGPTIFRALEQQLGLKLEPMKGPQQFIVIDRAERPSITGGARER
jgi:uncharacterized protein (TIGR03435 family)